MCRLTTPPPHGLFAPSRAPCALSRARPGARLHGCVSRLDRAQGHTAALCPHPGRIITVMARNISAKLVVLQWWGVSCDRNTYARDHTVHISTMRWQRSMTPGSHSTHTSEALWPSGLSPRQRCEANVRDNALVSAPLRSRSMLPSDPALQIRGSHRECHQPVGATSSCQTAMSWPRCR